MLNVVIFDPWQRSLFTRKRTPGKEPLLAGNSFSRQREKFSRIGDRIGRNFEPCLLCFFFFVRFAIYLRLWAFRRERMSQNRGGIGRKTHASSSPFLSRSWLYQTSIFRFKKGNLVMTYWSVVNNIEIQFFVRLNLLDLIYIL